MVLFQDPELDSDRIIFVIRSRKYFEFIPGILLTTRSKETSDDFLEQPGLFSELLKSENNFIGNLKLQSMITFLSIVLTGGGDSTDDCESVRILGTPGVETGS